MKAPILVINRASWHYRYSLWIRGIWNVDMPERTSLCPYFQTMLWLSVLTIIASPLFLGGWATAKGLLALDRRMENGVGFSRKVTLHLQMAAEGTCDPDLYRQAYEYERSDLDDDRSPYPTRVEVAVLSFLVALGATVIIGVAVGAISVVFISLYRDWRVIPSCLWEVFYTIGLGAHHVLFKIGEGLTYVGMGAVNLGKQFWMWAMASVSGASFWLFVSKCLAGGILMAIGLYLAHIFSQTEWATEQRVVHTTRAKERFAQVKNRSASAFRRCEYARNQSSAPIEQWWKKVARICGRVIFMCILAVPKSIARMYDLGKIVLIGKEVERHDAKRGNYYTRELGIIPVAFKFLVGLKKGFCPLVEFVDDSSVRISRDINPPLEL